MQPATQEEAEWFEGLVKEATPLQTAQIKVNALRIELAKVEEKISLGEPTTILSFLQKNKERKDMELSVSMADLDLLQGRRLIILHIFSIFF